MKPNLITIPPYISYVIHHETAVCLDYVIVYFPVSSFYLFEHLD